MLSYLMNSIQFCVNLNQQYWILRTMKQKSQQPIIQNAKQKGKIINNFPSKNIKFDSQQFHPQNKFDLQHIKKTACNSSSKKNRIIIQKQLNNIHQTHHKPAIEDKASSNNNCLFMKNDLKKLINKKTMEKQGYSNFVPDILKNIEKNCKILKNILEKEQKVSHRRDSWQSNKSLKPSSSNALKNWSQDLSQKNKNSKQKVKDSSKSNKNSKTMLSKSNKSISQDKLKIHNFMKEIQYKKRIKVTQEQKKIAQIFKSYKKSIDIQDSNPQKNKQTQYNTTQSRNSSSLLISSHRYSGLTAMYEQPLNNFKQVQNLIKVQQKIAETNNNIPEFSFKDQLYDKTVQNELELQGRRQNDECQTFKRTSFIPSSQQKSTHTKDQNTVFSKIIIDPTQLNPIQRYQNFLILNEKSKQQKSSKQAPNSKFIWSKYYVQPVPPQLPKKLPQPHQQQNSLAGCQIPIIQDNIFNDSQLQQFCI